MDDCIDVVRGDQPGKHGLVADLADEQRCALRHAPANPVDEIVEHDHGSPASTSACTIWLPI